MEVHRRRPLTALRKRPAPLSLDSTSILEPAPRIGRRSPVAGGNPSLMRPGSVRGRRNRRAANIKWRCDCGNRLLGREEGARGARNLLDLPSLSNVSTAQEKVMFAAAMKQEAGNLTGEAGDLDAGFKVHPKPSTVNTGS